MSPDPLPPRQEDPVFGRRSWAWIFGSLLLRPGAAWAAADGSSPILSEGPAYLFVVVFLIVLACMIFAAVAVLIWLVFGRMAPLWVFLGSVLRSVRQAVEANPDVVRLVERHPSASAFLKRRLRRGSFSGWPATLLAVAFGYVLLLLLGSVEDLVTADPIITADTTLANLLYSFRTPTLTRIMLWVTLLGKWQVVAVAAAVSSAFLLVSGRRGFAAGLWLSVLGGSIFEQLGKLAFHRPRPPVAEYLETSWSFPSGHATVTMALYGYLVFLFWRTGMRTRPRILLSSLGITVILAVGFSRLYLCVHYLSDVWSGYLLGLLCMIIGISVGEVLTNRDGKPVSWAGPGSARRFAALGLLIFLGVYILLGLRYHPAALPSASVPSEAVAGDILDVFVRPGTPRFTETLVGNPQEPLSFIILARDPKGLVETFAAAGWSQAEREGMNVLVMAGRAAFFNVTDPTAPMTPSFWNGAPHQFGFEKPLPGSGVRRRHHARFWATPWRDGKGRQYFVGTASLDVGMKWLIAHRIGPDIDTERDLLFEDLKGTMQVLSSRKEVFVPPTLGKNFLGDPFFTDGRVYVLELAD